MKIIPFDRLYAEAGIALGKRQLQRLEDQGHFPRRVVVSRKCWGYLPDEIASYLAALAAERTKIKAAPPTVAEASKREAAQCA